jgi:hypothetical protein
LLQVHITPGDKLVSVNGVSSSSSVALQEQHGEMVTVDGGPLVVVFELAQPKPPARGYARPMSITQLKFSEDQYKFMSEQFQLNKKITAPVLCETMLKAEVFKDREECLLDEFDIKKFLQRMYNAERKSLAGAGGKGAAVPADTRVLEASGTAGAAKGTSSSTATVARRSGVGTTSAGITKGKGGKGKGGKGVVGPPEDTGVPEASGPVGAAKGTSASTALGTVAPQSGMGTTSAGITKGKGGRGKGDGGRGKGDKVQKK